MKRTVAQSDCGHDVYDNPVEVSANEQVLCRECCVKFMERLKGAQTFLNRLDVPMENRKGYDADKNEVVEL